LNQLSLPLPRMVQLDWNGILTASPAEFAANAMVSRRWRFTPW
jgi:hypothetical protein